MVEKLRVRFLKSLRRSKHLSSYSAQVGAAGVIDDVALELTRWLWSLVSAFVEGDAELSRAYAGKQKDGVMRRKAILKAKQTKSYIS